MNSKYLNLNCTFDETVDDINEWVFFIRKNHVLRSLRLYSPAHEVAQFATQGKKKSILIAWTLNRANKMKEATFYRYLNKLVLSIFILFYFTCFSFQIQSLINSFGSRKSTSLESFYFSFNVDPFFSFSLSQWQEIFLSKKNLEKRFKTLHRLYWMVSAHRLKR